MTAVVARVRLTNGDQIDVTYEDPDTAEVSDLVDHMIVTLADDTGVLRTRHGDRLMVLYGRGVAALEVAPRGAVL
ncbi:MAG: hypothetical protein ACRDUA_25005 [Micromonosporaceae bacterium]